MNSNSDDYFDVELHGAANGELRSTESKLQKEVAKGSVENGFHDGKLSGALTPSSFENQSGSTKPSRTGAASEKKKTGMKQIVPFFKLFKYADRVDIFLMFLGTIMAIFDGFTWPAIAFIQSKLLNHFSGLATQSPRHSYDEICKVSSIFFSTIIIISARKESVCYLLGDCLLRT